MKTVEDNKYMGLDGSKPVFLILRPASTATKASYNIEILHEAGLGFIYSGTEQMGRLVCPFVIRIR